MGPELHLIRLKVMAEDKGNTWDLSPNDVSAIRWAIRKAEVADQLKAACEAMLNDRWDDNCEQYIYARNLATEAIMVSNSIE